MLIYAVLVFAIIALSVYTSLRYNRPGAGNLHRAPGLPSAVRLDGPYIPRHRLEPVVLELEEMVV